jgi:hypothetical protein
LAVASRLTELTPTVRVTTSVLYRTAGLRVAAAAATHAHWDHVLWAEALGAAPRLATARTAELVAAYRRELVEEPLARWGDEHYVRFDLSLAGRLQAAPADAARIDDPRLAAWPPMAATHAANARGLLAALRRGG